MLNNYTMKFLITKTVAAPLADTEPLYCRIEFVRE